MGVTREEKQRVYAAQLESLRMKREDTDRKNGAAGEEARARGGGGGGNKKGGVVLNGLVG